MISPDLVEEVTDTTICKAYSRKLKNEREAEVKNCIARM